MEPRFRIDDWVRVLEGTYEGQIGVVEDAYFSQGDYPSQHRYAVYLASDEQEHYFAENQLEAYNANARG